MKKKNWPIRHLAATGLGLFTLLPSQAQQTDSLLNATITEVVVTATRSEKNPADVGRGITVLSAKSLQNAPALHAADLLARQPGLYLVGAGQNPGMTQSIFMRGSNSNQTAILVDGVRLTDPSGVNNAMDLSELSLADADRIELVRGSHSTLYGSAAIGGVVNIISRKNQAPGFHPSVELQGGRFGKGTALFGQKLGLHYATPAGFYVNGAADNLRSQGLDATTDSLTRTDVYNKRDQDDYRRLSLSGKAGFRSARGEVYGSYKNTDMRTQVDKRAYTDDDNARVDFDRHFFTYGAAYKIKDWLEARYIGGYSRMFRQAEDDSSAVDSQGTSDHTYIRSGGSGSSSTQEVQANFTWPQVSGVIGLGHYGESMNATSYYYNKSAFGVYETQADLDSLNLGSTTRNVFLHVDLNGALLHEAFKKLNLAAGGRWNQHSRFGSYTTFELNPSFKLAPRTLLYGVLASGYNAPSLYQLYSPDVGGASGLSRGNPLLKPETSLSYELGLKQTLGNFRLGLSFFQTEVSNTIEYVYLWTAGKPQADLSFSDYQGDTYLNLSRQVSRGLEIDFFSALSPQVQVAGNLSIVNGGLKADPRDLQTSQARNYLVQLYNTGDFISRPVSVRGLVRRPATANIQITYQPWQKLALSSHARYAGARSDIFYDAGKGPFGALGTQNLGDYLLLDLVARLQLTSRLAGSLRAENLLNEKYEEINGFRTRGRGLFANLSYTL
ncbi:MAG: TonB-dependent receptor plug domain-containing protein [Adhaeribacter sp.]